MNTHLNDEISTGSRPTYITNGEWNQQTIYDARNVLQTQHSVEASQQANEQRSGKIAKPPIYPNHVLHPEIIPSLNEVPAELIKRRNIRFHDPSTIDSFETEIPLEIASSLQDELERAVQQRAAKDRCAEQQPSAIPIGPENNLFQSLHSKEPFPSIEIDESCDFIPQPSLPRTSIYDKSSLREAFQRIKIAGDFDDMSHIEDLEDSVGPLLRAMVIREKYMIFSLQSFPITVAKFLNKTLEQEDQSRRASSTIRANTEPKLKTNTGSASGQTPPKPITLSTYPRMIPQHLISKSVSPNTDSNQQTKYTENHSGT